jgi:PTH1 family peptidyl-tRNA hydrolase
MNLSGDFVQAIKNFYKIELKDILIIYDDIDIAPGTIRFRANGSGGTHNGMKDIIKKLSNDNIARLRLGIGKREGIPLADYVLDNFTKSEEKLLIDSFIDGYKVILDHIQKD